MAGTIASLRIALGLDSTGVGTGVAAAKQQLSTLGVAAGVIGLAITAASVGAIHAASDFEAELNTINTIAKTTPQNLGAIGDQVLDLSMKYGRSKDEISDGYYDLVSAGIKVADSQMVLTNASNLAVGGLASEKESVDLLTTAINAYGGDTTKAKQYTDEFAYAINVGKTTAAELAESYSLVAAMAAQMGIENRESAAAAGYLTAQGWEASQVFIYERQALNALLKPTSALGTLQKALGENFAQMARDKGLVATWQHIREEAAKQNVSLEQLTDTQAGLVDQSGLLKEGVDLNSGSLAKMTGRVQALQFVVGTTGDNFGRYEKTLAGVDSATRGVGEAQLQANERMKGAQFTWQRFHATLDALSVLLGNTLLPFVTGLADAATFLVGGIYTLTHAVPGLTAVLVPLASVLGGILTLSFGTKFLATMLPLPSAVRTAVFGLGGTIVDGLLAFVVSPAGLVLVGAAIVASLVVFDWGNKLGDVGGKIVKSVIDGIVNAGREWVANIGDWLSNLFHHPDRAFKAGADFFMAVLKGVNSVNPLAWVGSAQRSVLGLPSEDEVTHLRTVYDEMARLTRQRVSYIQEQLSHAVPEKFDPSRGIVAVEEVLEKLNEAWETGGAYGAERYLKGLTDAAPKVQSGVNRVVDGFMSDWNIVEGFSSGKPAAQVDLVAAAFDDLAGSIEGLDDAVKKSSFTKLGIDEATVRSWLEFGYTVQDVIDYLKGPKATGVAEESKVELLLALGVRQDEISYLRRQWAAAGTASTGGLKEGLEHGIEDTSTAILHSSAVTKLGEDVGGKLEDSLLVVAAGPAFVRKLGGKVEDAIIATGPALVKAAGDVGYEAGSVLDHMIGAGMRSKAKQLVGVADQIQEMIKDGLTPKQVVAQALGAKTVDAFRHGLSSHKIGVKEDTRDLLLATLAGLQGSPMDKHQARRYAQLLALAHAAGITDEQIAAEKAGCALVGQAKAGTECIPPSEFHTGGANAGQAWVNGLIASLHAGAGRAEDVLNQNYRGPFIGQSPPKTGPLMDIDRGGWNIGHAWATNFLAAVDVGNELEQRMDTLDRILSRSRVYGEDGGFSIDSRVTSRGVQVMRHEGTVRVELGPETIAAMRAAGFTPEDIGRAARAASMGNVLDELERMRPLPVGSAVE